MDISVLDKSIFVFGFVVVGVSSTLSTKIMTGILADRPTNTMPLMIISIFCNCSLVLGFVIGFWLLGPIWILFLFLQLFVVAIISTFFRSTRLNTPGFVMLMGIVGIFTQM